MRAVGEEHQAWSEGSGGYSSRLHLAITSGGYIWQLHLAITSGGYIWQLHLAVSSGDYERVHVVNLME